MICLRSAGVAIALAAIVCPGALAQTNSTDVMVGDLPNFSNNSTTTFNGVVYDSFAVGTSSCNKGNAVLRWTTGGTDNRHPAISQNLFRLRNGQFEQLGQGWLKHGFTALQENICSTQFGYGCTANPTGAALGVGCSDPYSAGLNNVSGSSPTNLGPKWQVNAANGLFPYPFYNYPPATGPAVTYSSTTGNTPGMIGPPRVRLSELNTQVAGDRYFMDAQYVAGDDAAATSGGFSNKFNNASWREVTLTATGTLPAATNFTIGGTGSTVRELPGIYAWAAADATVTTTNFDVPGDGRFILACKVSGAGPYVYEYALYNLNSHRCAGSFTVPLPGTQAALTAIGFHDCEVVGEPNSLPSGADPASDDWTVAGGGANASSIVWSGPAYNGTLPVYVRDGTSPGFPDTTYRVTAFTQGTGNDHTANVLRWATMFNFRFTSTLAPASGTVGVGLWRPANTVNEPVDPPAASITSFNMTVRTPGGATIASTSPTASCCLGTTCSVSIQAACSAGVWGAPGSTCSPVDPCDSGACCHVGTCTLTPSYGCTTGGFTQGGTCFPNNCVTTPGACCTNGGCGLTTQAACTSPSTWNGAASCTTNPCPQPGACCTSGACGVVLQTACTSPSTWNGAASCSTNPCPQPGACCNGGACTLTTQTSCTSAGGTWNGAASCSGVSCPTTFNDLCANALAVCDNVAITGTTAGTTRDGTATCGSSSTTPDVWFKYTPAVDFTNANFNTCGSSYDTVLSVYTGTCGNLTQLKCNDDSYQTTNGNNGNNACGNSGDGLRSGFNQTITAGTTYYIRVSGYNGATGAFIFKVVGGSGQGCTIPGACCTGATCGSVTYANCAGTWVGGTCGPTSCDPSGSCCSGATCTITTQSACTLTFAVAGTCSPNPCNPSGSCCSGASCSVTTQSACNLTFAAAGTCSPNPCNPSGSCCSGASCSVTTQSACTLTFAAGGTCASNPCNPSGTCCTDSTCSVVLQSECTLVFAAGGTSCTVNPCNPSGRCCEGGNCNVTLQHSCNGSFTVAGTCATNTCPPLNDNCDGRSGTNLGATPFDTTNATTDGPAHTLCNYSSDSQIGKDIWFHHPAQFTGTLDIDTCGSTFDTKIAVYDGYGCLNLETRILACNDDSDCTSGTTQSKILALPVLCGHGYTIRVGGWTNGSGVVQSGAGVLNLTSHPAATGACCDPSGACNLAYQSCCISPLNWNGASACTTSLCPLPNGACCGSDGSCTLSAQSACNGPNLAWNGSASCTSPNPCPQPGACCAIVTGNCAFVLESACNGKDTSWLGASTSCSFGNPCPQPDGACCAASGACTMVQQSACTSPLSWSGVSSCTAPNPCPQPGACCTTASGACDLRLQALCVGTTVTWNGSASCTAPNPCPQPVGACCSASGTCSITLAGDCTGVSFLGVGTACSPNVCPQPGACCNGTTCTSVVQSLCTGSFMGVGVTCQTQPNPTTCCVANFNQVNGLTISDVFDFLNAWFAGDPATNIDGVPGLQINDIFFFLNSWFAGCP